MRVFPCLPDGPPYRWARSAAAGALFFLAPVVLPSSLFAQWPGEIRGRVVDAATGAGVQGAVVELAEVGRSTRTDGSGEFRIRSLESGTYRLSATALGYARSQERVEVENAAAAEVVLELVPEAVSLEGLRVEGERRPGAGAHRIGRSIVDASGARSADELLRSLPGVTVQSRGPGSPATVSLRGSGEDAVLVLVDGVPLNDPLSGEADLSTLSASTVEEITVLPGARSARYGPRAKGGVILVTTRGPELGGGGELTGGSLGLLGSRADAGILVGGFEVGAGLEGTRREGSFRFRKPAEVGGGGGVRRNADLAQSSLRLGLAGEAGGGELRSRFQAETLDRGLPGKSFAPSLHARQDLDRVRWVGSWERSGPSGSLRLSVSGTGQAVTHRDPAPPFGRPYADTTSLAHLSARTDTDRLLELGEGSIRVSLGAELDHQGVRSTGLAETAPASRTDLGVWAGSTLSRPQLPGSPELGGTLRIHRDGLLDDLVPTHEVTASASHGPLSVHMAHRSGYSPPTLGDQFFHEGVAIEPNPDLQAERVPNEWELGLEASGIALSGFDVSARASAFKGDVRGMIVWSPDFRFVWSPRNVDVNRHGLEAQADLRHAGTGLRLGGAYTLARATYARDEGEPVQVIYRPRHTGNLRLGWRPAPGWDARLEARYLGTRYPVPARLNALPGFWSFDLMLRGGFALGRWSLEPSLRVDRLLDRKDSFIFAFPEPGRTWSLGLRIRTPHEPPAPM